MERFMRVIVPRHIPDSSPCCILLIFGSKYLVGADGGASTVRNSAKIPFSRDQTTLRWVRIDGLMETDMPDSNFGFGAIESQTHGNVLWVNLDHGRNRIGYAVPKEM